MKCNGLDEYPLSYYCIVIGGGTPKTSVPEYWGGNIPWISIKDIVESNNIIENTEKTITEEGLNNSSTKILDKGDIIISARGTVGKIALISKPMAFNQSCFGIKVNRNVDPVFFYYVLVNSISTIKKNTQGSVFDTITAKTFDSIRIAMPTFEVQRRIGSFLSSIDSQINANMRINDYLSQISNLLFSRIYTESELHNALLSDLAVITMGQSPPGDTYNECGNGTLFYQGRAEFGEYCPSPRLYTTNPKRMARVGDILLSVRAPVGDINLAGEDCCIGRGLASIRSMNGHQAFIHYLIESLNESFDVFNGDGTVFGSINKDSLNNLTVEIPNTDVIRSFDDVASTIDKIIKTNCDVNKSLTKIREYLLPRLMSGEINLSNLDLGS